MTCITDVQSEVMYDRTKTEVGKRHQARDSLMHSTYLHEGKLVIDNEWQQSQWCNEEFYSESVMVAIICSSKLSVHQINRCKWRGHEDHFHGRVVQWHKWCEKIKVASWEDYRKHQLRFARQSLIHRTNIINWKIIIHQLFHSTYKTYNEHTT